jgi:hypothetical protein
MVKRFIEISSNSGCKLLTDRKDYIDYRTIIRLQCKCGREFKTTFANFKFHTRRCKHCIDISRKRPSNALTDKEFKARIRKIVENEYTFLEPYKSYPKKMLCRHNDCGYIFHVSPSGFYNGKRCPACSGISKGEKRIRDFLRRFHFNFKEQYRIDECRNKRTLPFDFAVLDDKDQLLCLIEFDGIQHYKVYNNKVQTEEMLKNVQKRDAIKTKYCVDNGINLIRIPYWDYKNIHSILRKRLVMTEVGFKCKCGEPVLAMIHRTEEYDEAVCLECGRKYKVYRPVIEEAM